MKKFPVLVIVAAALAGCVTVTRGYNPEAESTPSTGTHALPVARIVQSQQGGAVLAEVPAPAFHAVSAAEESKGYDPVTIFLDPQSRFQTLEGIGGALTESSCYLLMKMPPAMREQVLKSYFAPDGGCGYDVVRISMNSCDFSLSDWTCDDVDGDFGLTHFSIDNDRRYVLPVLKEAIRLHPGLKVLVSPWSAPAWMKTSRERAQGGKLRPECRPAWALFYAKYIEALAKEGVKVWAVTVQNEPNATQPWESMIVSAQEEAAFVRDNLGPTLAARGHGDVKIMIWDHNREFVYNRAAVVYRDPAAAKYVWGTAYHWYVGHNYDNLTLTHDTFPDKKLFLSEACVEYALNPANEWTSGERYTHDRINDFNRWATGWTDWNVVLDQHGGPRHPANPCGAAYIYDTGTGRLHVSGLMTHLRHFHDFLRAGAVRIACASARDELEATAFENPDGSFIMVVLNRTDKPMDFTLMFADCVAKGAIPAHAVQTWRILR